MEIFHASKQFPAEERYSLTDQVRRLSRSVCANAAKAWRKRRYPAAFVSKLNDAEAEASETQTWIAFAFDCQYISSAQKIAWDESYEGVLKMLVSMQHNADRWCKNVK